MDIKQRVIPSNMRSRTNIKIIPTSITIHETDNLTADAENHAVYLEKNNISVDSWHFTVDDKQIIQHLSIYEEAFHAGDGRTGPGNSTSIGIEMCVKTGMDLEKVRKNTQELCKYLLKNYIPHGQVFQHNHWTGKDCPHILRKENKWSEFITGIYSDQIKPINIALETQKFLNKLQITDYENKPLAEDGQTGTRTRTALNKLVLKL